MNVRIARGFAVTLALVGACCFASAQPAADKLDDLLVHIAPEAHLIIAAPSLKRLNDDLVELFGGMDRADLVTAGRPIDLAKSMLGLGGGIDDRRGAAVAALLGEDVRPAMIAIIPVVEPDAFLETNFKRDDASGAYVSSTGDRVYIRELADRFMLLSDNETVVEHYQPGAGAKAVLERRFGVDAATFFARGELIIAMDAMFIRELARDLPLPTGPPGRPAIEQADAARQRADAVMQQIDGLAYVVDVDPLGVVVHGLVTFMPESDLAQALQPQATVGAAWLESLPDKKYYWAGNINLTASGAQHVLEVTASLFDIKLTTSKGVLEKAAQISFMASPSPAGLTGGLLNDAAVVFHAADPQAMHAAVRKAMNEFAERGNAALAEMAPDGTPPSTIELSWTDQKKVGDTGLTADAYEIRIPVGNDMTAAMARSLVFGQNQRGFLATTDSAVVMTFSQRPAVLEAAIDAVSEAGPSLADDDALASVARWLGEPAPVEVFISLGQLNKFAALAARSFGAVAGEVQMPELDPNGPPIALRFGAGDRSMTSMLGLPAPVLADILREVERSLRPFTGADVDAP